MSLNTSCSAETHYAETLSGLLDFGFTFDFSKYIA